MKENGKMIKLMDLENIYTQMAHNMKVIGKKINSMEKVGRHGQMVHAMREIM
jgi:hypothetical protein